MTIEEINADRIKFIGKAKENIETELNKVGFSIININNADISDDANYIKNLGQKAATKALAQADIAEEKKKGDIQIAETNKQREIAVADAEKERETTVAQTRQEQEVRVAEINQEKEIKLAEAEKNKQSGIANQKAEQAANIAKANTAAESEKAKAEAEKISAIAKAQAEADSNRAESESLAEAKAEADSKKAEASAQMFEHVHLGQVTVYGNENTAGNFMAKTAENLNPAFDLLRSITFADTLKSVLGKKELEEKKAETTEFEEVK